MLWPDSYGNKRAAYNNRLDLQIYLYNSGHSHIRSLRLANWTVLCHEKRCFSCLTIITNTCLYNFDPLKPHFYIVKLGFTGVYIIFLISAQKHRLWVLVRTVGWLGEANVSCILRHGGIQLILAYSWARPATTAAGAGRGGCFHFFCFFTFIHFHPSPLSRSFISSTISYFSSPSSGKRHKITHKGWCVVKSKHNQSLGPPMRSGFNEYPQSMFWAEIWKNIRFFYLKCFSFWF